MSIRYAAQPRWARVRQTPNERSNSILENQAGRARGRAETRTARASRSMQPKHSESKQKPIESPWRLAWVAGTFTLPALKSRKDRKFCHLGSFSPLDAARQTGSSAGPGEITSSSNLRL